MQVANHVLERLGSGQVTAELLQPDELVSGMMAQIAAEPSMAHLLTDFIYSPEGALAEEQCHELLRVSEGQHCICFACVLARLLTRLRASKITA